MGCARPALLATAGAQSYVADVVAAYREWCDSHGISPLVARVDGPPTESAAADAATCLLQRPDRPDAIHATLERLAIGVLLAAERLSIAVPDELAVTAGSDAPSLESFRPAVTALYLDGERIGHLAASLVIDLLEGDQNSSRDITVDTDLRVRASTLKT